MKDKTILKMTGITKLYPGVRALDNVDFDLRAGEVHLLIGENGAGKSTLGKILAGFTKLTNGKIELDEDAIDLGSTARAFKHGIVAVYQEMSLVPYLSVSQNIFLNMEYKTKLGFLDIKRMERESEEILALLDCDYINPSTMIKMLSVAEQQMVEIAKALIKKPRIIIFDEPTGTLSEREVESLFAEIRRMTSRNIGIIYISHRMAEFRQIGDRVTVLRDGSRIGTYNLADVTDQELVNMMVGRELSQVYVRTANDYVGTALETKNLSDLDGKVKNVSIKVRKGEIVGLCGLIGSGRTDTAQLIFGIKERAAGEVLVKGEKVDRITPRGMVERGIGLVSEDRKRYGLALNLSVKWNILGVSLDNCCRGIFLNHKNINKVANVYKDSLQILVPSINKKCNTLSGGNQQKVVLAKWFSQKTDILIFDEPTRGIDVGTKMEIYKIMDELVTEGNSILMISSELQEIIGMSDRVYVMRDGAVRGEIARGSEQFNVECIGSLMMGYEN